LNCGF